MDKLKESNASLTSKCEELKGGYACATNSLSCAANLKQENQDLKDQIERLSNKYVNLQATHKELECSYKRLVESHTMLEVASEVMLNSVKSYESHHHTCTCTQAKFDISCANPCGPKGKTSWYEDVLVESCDELLVQENEDLMQEVKGLKNELINLKGKEQVRPSQDNRDPVVKKLEKGSNITCSAPKSDHKGSKRKTQEKKKLDHIKCFKCSHMGHYASMCSFNQEGNSNQSKRQRSISQRRCFGCHEKGHKIEACMNKSRSGPAKSGGTDFVNPVAPVFAGKPDIKLNKGFLKAQARFMEKKDFRSKINISSNIKQKICYTCRQKGHLGKDYPNGNTTKPNFVNSVHIQLRRSSSGDCASRMIKSSTTHPKAIWVPKSLLTNLHGPNVAWVPKCA